MFPYIAYQKHVTPRAGPFLPQRHNSNTHGRGPLDDATYQVSRPYGFRLDVFMFPYISLCKACDTKGWGHVCPQGHHLNKLGRGPLVDATYKILRLYALWSHTFFHVSLYTPT